jgi:predicted porin
MAQVTIDGYVDRAYTITNNTNNTSDSKLLSSAAGTTTLGIKVRESLSSDLSAGISLNTDFADQGGQTQDPASANTVTSLQQAGFANGQSFVDLTSKSMGTLRLGSPNNFTLTNVSGVASPGFSTGIGSAYGSSFTIHNGLGTGVAGTVGLVNQQAAITSTANSGARAIRIANTVQYSSPVMNGFSVHLGSTAKNSNGGTGTDTVGVTEYALRYTNGPIDAMYTNIKYTVGNAPTNGSITANTDNTQDMLGASYAINPALKLHAGFGNTKSSTNVYKGKSQQFGVSYTIGAVNLMAQMAKFDDTSSTNVDRKMTGLGANYNLSKTARLYVRMDNINYGSNVAAADGSVLKRTAIGVSKSF